MKFNKRVTVSFFEGAFVLECLTKSYTSWLVILLVSHLIVSIFHLKYSDVWFFWHMRATFELHIKATFGSNSFLFEECFVPYHFKCLRPTFRLLDAQAGHKVEKKLHAFRQNYDTLLSLFASVQFFLISFAIVYQFFKFSHTQKKRDKVGFSSRACRVHCKYYNSKTSISEFVVKSDLSKWTSKRGVLTVHSIRRMSVWLYGSKYAT